MTFQGLKQIRNSNKSKVPDSSDEFMLTLKRFANLLFAIFSEDCPYFKCVQKIIITLKKLSRSARIALSKTTKASILWIILLQGCQFAIGQLGVLAEFQAMHTSLTAQQGTIVHAEVPNKLLEDITVNKKQPADSSNTSKEGDQTLAKCHTEPMKNNSNFWNSKLKEMLTLPMEIARNPNVPGCHKILTFCGAQPGAVFGPGSRVCSPNAFFSRCCLGNKCT